MKHKRIQRTGPSVSTDDIDAISRVLEGKQLSRDSRVGEFERNIASYIGRKHAVSTTSGFAALHLALLTLEVGKDDEVIIPSCTCHALLHAVRCTGATPIVVDSDYENMSLSMKSYNKAVSSWTKAVIIPHTFGFPVDIAAFRRDGVAIVEDCAAALGGSFNGKMLGSFGDISVLSFYATKMITTGGEGGAVLMDDQTLAVRARLIGDYKDDAPPWGPCYSYRMTEIQAAMGISQLWNFGQARNARAALYRKYAERLDDAQWSGGVQWNWDCDSLPSFYTYVLKLDAGSVRSVATHLAERDIECLPGGYMGIHRLLELNDRDFPGAVRLLDEVLLLPLHSEMSVDDVNYVCDSLEEVL